MSKKKITGIAVVIWMAVIFAFSAQPARQSSKASKSVSYKIAEWQNYIFNQGKTEEELSIKAESMQLIVRKGAHMSEYAILAVLICFYFSYDSISKKRMALQAFAFTAGYAATDELHQLFVPGRAGRLSDVCIDSLGGGLGIMFFLFLFQIYNKWKKTAVRRENG